MIIQSFFRSILKIRSRYLERVTSRAELRNIERKKHLWSTVELSPLEDNEICNYWKKISGCDIDTRWHRLYASYLDCRVKKDFFPEILYSTKLEKQLSNPKFYGVLSDKGFLTTIFPGDDTYRNPKTVVYNSYGNFVDGDKHIITRSEAETTIGNAGLVIIKPSIDTSSGEGVLKANFVNGYDSINDISVEEVLKKYGQNFLVQECVKQSHYLSDLCEKSLNTFRVITYVKGGGILCTSQPKNGNGNILCRQHPCWWCEYRNNGGLQVA